MRSASLITEEHCNPLSYYHESKLTIHFKRLDSLSALCILVRRISYSKNCLNICECALNVSTQHTFVVRLMNCKHYVRSINGVRFQTEMKTLVIARLS